MGGKKIGLFGGTFDPIHFGHLNLAFELMEKHQLDQVWFIPAQINPFKIDSSPQTMEERLAMVRLAIEGIPQFQMKDLEKDRPAPSYTIDTLKTLLAEEVRREFPSQFYLLLGEDAAAAFHHWHQAEEIVKLVPLLIGLRPGAQMYEWEVFPHAIREAIETGVTPIRQMDISGTEVRRRLSKGAYCGHLVPQSVLDYLKAREG